MCVQPSLEMREKLLGGLSRDPGPSGSISRAGERPAPPQSFHLYQEDDLFILFNSLSLRKVCGSRTLQKVHEILQRLDDRQERLRELLGQAGYDELHRSGLLETPGPDSPCRGDASAILYLVLTNRCNLRCRYCAGGRQDPDMSMETAKKGIDLFLSRISPGRAAIVAGGGEPLLNWSALEGVLLHLEKKEGITIILPTNGLLLTPGRAGTLSRHNVEVQFALDGEKRHHDRMRINPRGMGSWEGTLDAYELYKKVGKRSSITCRIFRHNIRDIEDISHFFADRLEARQVHFQILSDVEVFGEASEDLAGGLLRSFELFRRAGIDEPFTMRKLKAFVYEEPVTRRCADASKTMTVTPDGRTGLCPVLARRVSAAPASPERSPGGGGGEPVVDCGRAGTSDLPDECMACPAAGMCAGPCAAERLLEPSTGGFHCQFNRMLVRSLIKELAGEVRQAAQGGRRRL